MTAKRWRTSPDESRYSTMWLGYPNTLDWSYGAMRQFFGVACERLLDFYHKDADVPPDYRLND